MFSKFFILSAITVVLSSYDFDGTLSLNTDEVTLALKSVASGLSKVTSVQAPRDSKIEQLVTAVYIKSRHIVFLNSFYFCFFYPAV